MTSVKLRFEPLSRRFQKALLEMAAEFREEGDDRYDLLIEDPERYFDWVKRFEHDRDLPVDRVPMSHYLLFADDRLVGGSRLRRRLGPSLLFDGGNIGYEVRRSARRRGHGTEILCRTLDEARAIALDRVLLTAEESNVASIRMIEAAGGIPAGDCVSPRTGARMRRFWIDLGATA